ncbi:hypothetical protein A1351_06425 [Methylosinus sp. R-45379]|nr:hypothetical protein A1351_06425 [Methylosinus sp. R-45379]
MLVYDLGGLGGMSGAFVVTEQPDPFLMPRALMWMASGPSILSARRRKSDCKREDDVYHDVAILWCFVRANTI